MEPRIQIHAQAFGGQLVEQWFQDVVIVVAEVEQDSGTGRFLDCPQVAAERLEKAALGSVSACVGQEITCHQNNLGQFRPHGEDQVSPLGPHLVQVTGEEEAHIQHRYRSTLPVLLRSNAPFNRNLDPREQP
jgi:hypothetical protein